MNRTAVALTILLLCVPAAAASQTVLDDVRALYVEAVTDERALDAGLRAIAGGHDAPPVLEAYEGALTTLRAAHSSWPLAQLRHVRHGLRILDRLVAAHPAHTEIRYLRLMSCFHLPALLGRDWSVREDLDALVTLLPTASDVWPGDMYEDIVRFVLANAPPDDPRRAALRSALGPE